MNDQSLFSTLLACGADPNTVLPARCDKDFLALVSLKSLRGYIEGDKDVTVLMLAAGLGKEDYLRALLQAGADRKRATARYKMLPLYIAAQTGHWRCTQILLGRGPSPDQLRIEISLASQRVALIKNGVPIFRVPVFDRPPRIFHAHWPLCDYGQKSEPSFLDLPRGDAVLHASQLSRFRDACRAWCRIIPLHTVAFGYPPKLLANFSPKSRSGRS